MDNIELKKIDYDNEYNLRGFYEEYIKAQQMILETKRLYMSFMLSKLKPLNNFITTNIDRLTLYRFNILHNDIEIRVNNHFLHDNMPLYLARYVFPIIHQKLHEETLNDAKCPWIYPLQVTTNDVHIEQIYNDNRYNISGFNYDHLIEKKSGIKCYRGSIPCYPSLVGCRDYHDYEYKKLSESYIANKLTDTIFESSEELRKSYSKYEHILWQRFDEIKHTVFEEMGPTLNYLNKFTICINLDDLTTVISDMVLKKDAVFPTSIFRSGLYSFYPIDNSQYNKSEKTILCKKLICDFDIKEFKKSDITWYQFVSFCNSTSIYSNRELFNYIDYNKVKAFIDEMISDYLIQYLSCFEKKDSQDDYNNLYILVNNEPKFVCKKSEVKEFDIDVQDNKLICLRTYTERKQKGGPSWRPITQITYYTKLSFDIDTNELLSFNTWNSSENISFN